jgi:hypothetical protein
MGCMTEGYTSVISDYSASGWASACLNYFETSTASPTFPYYQEQDRLNAGVEAVPTDRGLGERILDGQKSVASRDLSWCISTADCHGSWWCRYAPRMARWQGTGFTAGCFFDGNPNQAVTRAVSASLLATGNIRAPLAPRAP